tara:strand:- start:867 stop:1334 length:468 start_codon:yes stop_codon:yes gene_type:complete
MAVTIIQVQSDDFDIGEEVARVRKPYSVGAIAVFIGLVRDFNSGDDVSGMTLEHYPGMTEKSIQEIVDSAADRWSLKCVSVVHRIGSLLPGDQIVFVGVSSSHRAAAFEACEFVMDYLKTRAPFWKKEKLGLDKSRWVDSRETDQKATKRWGGVP